MRAVTHDATDRIKFLLKNEMTKWKSGKCKMKISFSPPSVSPPPGRWNLIKCVIWTFNANTTEKFLFSVQNTHIHAGEHNTAQTTILWAASSPPFQSKLIDFTTLLECYTMEWNGTKKNAGKKKRKTRKNVGVSTQYTLELALCERRDFAHEHLFYFMSLSMQRHPLPSFQLRSTRM